MDNYADYITRIEIDSLWSGRGHIVWTLDRHVNILSGINGVGKSTIINKAIRELSADTSHTQLLTPAPARGVHISTSPEGARRLRFDVIRSMDRPLVSAEVLARTERPLATELDWQLYQLQRRYLSYQVNTGNRIIAALQSGEADAAHQAELLAQPKRDFQDAIDALFAETGKTIIRTENEIAFTQAGERLTPYQLSSGEKQMLAILLTTLTEDRQCCVLFMDEPEVSLHIEWQKQLIDLILRLNPNVQIILTTHSPAVIMNGWMDRVTEVSDITMNTQ